jgi:hypothetical protein
MSTPENIQSDNFVGKKEHTRLLNDLFDQENAWKRRVIATRYAGDPQEAQSLNRRANELGIQLEDELHILSNLED